MPSTDLGKVALRPCGAYDPAAQYERLDLVEYQGSSFVARRPVRGVEPVDGEDYMLLARGGRDGKTPVKGEDYTDGKNGRDGSDGVTPHIGGNGNWWIGDVDTGIAAHGQGLPPVTDEDEGNVAGVVDGAWGLVDTQWRLLSRLETVDVVQTVKMTGIKSGGMRDYIIRVLPSESMMENNHYFRALRDGKTVSILAHLNSAPIQTTGATVCVSILPEISVSLAIIERNIYMWQSGDIINTHTFKHGNEKVIFDGISFEMNTDVPVGTVFELYGR